jgi:ADP-ribose pyrophosphatase YjhB (NUDIX family)
MTGIVRISAKAVIVADGRVLLIKHRDSFGDWYSLPGGGQKHGEILEEAVRRECLEEICVHVRMGRLLFVREYIGQHHEFADEDGEAHQVELMFECELVDGTTPVLGLAPDETQTGVEWLELSDLARCGMYPKPVALILAKGVPSGGAVYLGDVN